MAIRPQWLKSAECLALGKYFPYRHPNRAKQGGDGDRQHDPEQLAAG
jgi:hypothetical protein